MVGRLTMGLAALAAWMVLGGCSSDDSTGATGTGGAGAGGHAEGPWDCVGHVVYPPASGASVEATWTFYHLADPYDPADGAPFEGATVEICAAGTDCSTPLDTAVTDAQGQATLTLPTEGHGFDGYLRTSGDGILTWRHHFFPPIAEASSRWLESDIWLPVVIAGAREIVSATVAGEAADPTKGDVVAYPFDCHGIASTAVSVTANGLSPDNSYDGENVFFNVEPGPVEIVATLADDTEIARILATVEGGGQVVAVHFGPMPTP